jgi:hypothetical protein
MLMRFNIEQRHLTDPSGRPVASNDSPVSFHIFDAESASEAVQHFVDENSAELIGSILKFPGFQAVATVRNTGGVYTLQVTPASQNIARPS